MARETHKAVVWLHGAVKTPPFSAEARIQAGMMLALLQRGEVLSLPLSRPMPSIGVRCHELRLRDREHNWRIFYRTDPEAIAVLGVLDKKTRQTPKAVIAKCQRRLQEYEKIIGNKQKARSVNKRKASPLSEKRSKKSAGKGKRRR